MEGSTPDGVPRGSGGRRRSGGYRPRRRRPAQRARQLAWTHPDGCRRLNCGVDDDQGWQRARNRVVRAARCDAQIEGGPTVVPDVPGVEARTLVCIRWPVVCRVTVTGFAPVHVIKVQTAHLLVVVGRRVDMRSGGYEAERQVGCTTTERQEPSHGAILWLLGLYCNNPHQKLPEHDPPPRIAFRAEATRTQRRSEPAALTVGTARPGWRSRPPESENAGLQLGDRQAERDSCGGRASEPRDGGSQDRLGRATAWASPQRIGSA